MKGIMDEETLKVRVAEEYFGKKRYGTLGKIDFAIYEEIMGVRHYHLWAEAKKGNVADIKTSFVQLILTIGKERTFTKEMPPKFLGAIDQEKISFIEYHDIQHVFSQNDFNWNVAPSDHGTKEFGQLYEMVEGCLAEKALHFSYATSDGELRKFIADNFVVGKEGHHKIQVDKNNFVHVFNQWLQVVKPTIMVKDWGAFNRMMIMSADFFLADLMSDGEKTIIEKLRVLYENHHYRLKIKSDALFADMYTDIVFSDHQKAHTEFWNIYERPPKDIYINYILERRDLLVPQDIRERKGAYFTPQKWVNLSQQYIAKALGDDWQDEYYIWDCCAGTGNLLVGLTNKYKIFASTLDQADVDIMKERAGNGANLLEGNVFQFDFLNDSFDDPKVPEELREIIKDEEKRKRLVVYINPPYAEAPNKTTIQHNGVHKDDVSVSTKTYKDYIQEIGLAGRELYAQFLIRINLTLKGAIIGVFSKIKHLQGNNFKKFRNVFKPKLESCFLMPADTFDNVSGQFPIGFCIWDTNIETVFDSIVSDVYDKNGDFIKTKIIESYDGHKTLTDWTIATRGRKNEVNIGWMSVKGCDFQHNNLCYILNRKDQEASPRGTWITSMNIVEMAIYYTVRHCVSSDWTNDRDQYVYPNSGWKNDDEFKNDCLAYTLFGSQNTIKAEQGVNHWIPFTEKEVEPRRAFKSHFMTDYISGKVARWEDYGDELGGMAEAKGSGVPLEFSEEAKAVFDAGRELWRYYHRQEGAVADASYYDIRRYFQGVNEKGKMNGESGDGEYMRLVGELKREMKRLGGKIEGKVWGYGFLR